MQKTVTLELGRTFLLALTPLILVSLFSGATIAGEEEGWVIQLETPYVEIRLARGGASALLIEEGRKGYAIVDEDSRKKGDDARSHILGNEVIEALPLPNSNAFIVVEVSSQSGEPVTKITHQLASGDSFDLELNTSFRSLSNAVLGTDLRLYLGAAEKAEIARMDLCNEEVLKIEDCQKLRSKSGKLEVGGPMLELLGPPVVDTVVDSISDILVASQRGSSEIVGVDTSTGKLLFSQDFSPHEPPLRIASAIDEIATFFVSSSGAGLIEIFDIDRDFREWIPAGRIDLRALGDAPALSFSLNNKDEPNGNGFDTRAWQDLAGKVVASPNQRALLIAGLEPNTIHLIERKGTTNRLILDILSDGLNVIDFTLSPDGGHLGILLEGMMMVLPLDPELLVIDKRAETVKPNGIAPTEKALAIAIQTRLSQEGFYRGVVDGVWGPQSQSALSRFQFRNGIDGIAAKRPTETDVATLGALFVNDIESFPVDTPDNDLAKAVRDAAFASFFTSNLPMVDFFDPEEIYTVGRGAAAAKCRAMNSFPDQSLWPNILPTIRQLDKIRSELSKKIHVRSTFQTVEYADCVSTPADLVALHGAFRAIEFIIDELEVTPEQAARLSHILDTSDSVMVRAGESSFFIATLPHALPTEQLGDWQAVIASYRPGPLGCAAAQADVEEFAELLSGAGLEGKQIYIARTTISNHYAVTVDAGQNPEWAQHAVDIIHKVASRTVDGKTGADAFPQNNKGWQIDDGCRNVRILD